MSTRQRGFVQLDNDLFLRAAAHELDTVGLAIIGVVEARRNGKTGRSFASYPSIGASIGKSADTVKRRVKRMRVLGLLVVSDRQHDKRGHPTGHDYDFAPLFKRLAAGSHQGTDAHQGTHTHQGTRADPTRAPMPPEQDVRANKTGKAPRPPQAGDHQGSTSSEQETLQLHRGGSTLHAVPNQKSRTVDLFAPPTKSAGGRKQGRRRDHAAWQGEVAAFVAEHYPDPDWADGHRAKACEAVEQAIRRGARTPEQVREHVEYWWIEPVRRARSAS
jgi:hypothetical protein